MNTAEGHELKDDLSNYDDSKYKKPSVTVDIVICSIFDDDLKVLLIKRKFPPFRDCWAIPGGFVNVDAKETLIRTAERELEEETGINNIDFLEQLKTYGDPDRDPRTRIITVVYYALIPYPWFSNQNVEANDDAKEALWFSLRNLPDNLAFDHKTILEETLNRIIGKITYTPIAFGFLPKKFTWAELQKVFEIVLGKTLYSYPFRRKINSMYKITELKDKIKNKKQGRPSSHLIYDGIKEL